VGACGGGCNPVSWIAIVNGIDIRFIPASLYCYLLGYNIIKGKERSFDVAVRPPSPPPDEQQA
jgi:hypothetical protein